MLGIGCAEGSGYLSALLKKMVSVTPRAIITPVVVLLGVMSNIATDIGYVVLIPVGALVFMAYGRHPLAGLAAAFAGVSGGFSANLLIGALDPLLAGISTEAAHIVDSGYTVLATDNWFFMIASTVLIVAIGTLVTDKIVEPRLGRFEQEEGQADHRLLDHIAGIHLEKRPSNCEFIDILSSFLSRPQEDKEISSADK